MKKLLTLAALCLTVGSSQAVFMDGNKLHSRFLADDGTAEVYVAGVLDSLMERDLLTIPKKSSNMFCPPPNTTLQQVSDIVKKGLMNSPEIRAESGYILTIFFSYKTWPCLGKKSL